MRTDSRATSVLGHFRPKNEPQIYGFKGQIFLLHCISPRNNLWRWSSGYIVAGRVARFAYKWGIIFVPLARNYAQRSLVCLQNEPNGSASLFVQLFTGPILFYGNLATLEYLLSCNIRHVSKRCLFFANRDPHSATDTAAPPIIDSPPQQDFRGEFLAYEDFGKTSIIFVVAWKFQLNCVDLQARYTLQGDSSAHAPGMG